LKRGFIKRYSKESSLKFKDTEELYIFVPPEDVPPFSGEEESTDPDETGEDLSVKPDDFEILHAVGRGGFAKVVKAKKKDNGKIYAMKIMNKTKISGQRQLQCLIAEKKIMLNDNPFLVHLYYSFQTTEQLYFVMDFISGGDLAFHLDQKGKFNEKEVRFITAEIVLALEHLHSCGIVYRDLKLENILLDKDGHICLTDFGLSKELESISGTTKTVCGTPTYLAPEVLLGKPYGNSIDWWSLGVVTYELFTGMNPFDASDFDAVLHNILNTKIQVPPEVVPTGKDLIEKLLQRNPKLRLCSGPTGSAEIQNHDFYESIDWKKMMVKSIKAPYKPTGQDNFDKSVEDSEVPHGKGLNPNLNFGGFEYASKSDLLNKS